ncbi:MAG: hypothetical protein JXM70_30380 [Pirellulales bacterium]|nr:hypothetical protein [Pirellulales bacterium]
MHFHVPVTSAAFVFFGICLASAGEVLYNGIELPDPWPPRIKQFQTADKTDPVLPHYLKKPPVVVPIDIGRQLFVDDFLIESTTLLRAFHKLQPYAGNPILKPDKPWESSGRGKELHGAFAMPFSDGVWYDPQDQLFKMWYMGGLLYSTCYATSKDGLNWEKPELDVVPGTNIVHRGNRDSNTVWLGLDEKDPQRRYKMFRFEKIPKWGLAQHFSADGIHWSKQIRRAGHAYDRTTAFYNPFRKVWCYSIKGADRRSEAPKVTRIRRYWEMKDLMTSPTWSGETSSLLWFHTDRLDPPMEGTKNRRADNYCLDAVAYESLMLGLFTIHQRETDEKLGRPKKNEIFLGFSRDGFYWDRPLREPFVAVSETASDWNWGNVQSVGGGCLIVGDKLYFYYSGRAGKGYGTDGAKDDGFLRRYGATGVGFLRRDGFASMDAGDTEGTLTSRPVTFKGKHLFVNAAAKNGQLCAEILDQQGSVIEPYSKANCEPVCADKTQIEVRWKGAKDLSALSGKTVRFRFTLRNGSLFAFWVSPEASGASHGYVAAGGPGLKASTDTVGQQ